MESVSVIIPTHNRCFSVQRAINALATQTYPFQNIEVIVVADGCTDSTLDILNQCETPFSLQVIEQPARGAAAARNQGASCAKGTLLIFLDDDIEASSRLIEAHVESHQKYKNRVVIGYLPTVLSVQKGFFKAKLRAWWESMFLPMSFWGHRFSYRDLLSGNFSIKAELFEEVGGFDPVFKCQEDYELGFRLIQGNAEFLFSPDALGYHHEITQLDRSLQRKYHEGKAAVQFGKKYPELISTLPLLHLLQTKESLLVHVVLLSVFFCPRLSDLLAYTLRRWLNLLEWFCLRGSWQRLLDQLLGYWYVRGVAAELKSWRDFKHFLKSQRSEEITCDEELKLDLKNGLDASIRVLDSCEPKSCDIYFGSVFLGSIPPSSGLERLKGKHLRSLLYSYFYSPLIEVLRIEAGLSENSFNDSILSSENFNANTSLNSLNRETLKNGEVLL